MSIEPANIYKRVMREVRGGSCAGCLHSSVISHRMSTVIEVRRRNMLGKPLGEYPGFPKKIMTLNWLRLALWQDNIARQVSSKTWALRPRRSSVIHNLHTGQSTFPSPDSWDSTINSFSCGSLATRGLVTVLCRRLLS